MTDDPDKPIIPEPTTIEQAEADGVATRIASGDTEGGSDQFEAPGEPTTDRPDGPQR